MHYVVIASQLVRTIPTYEPANPDELVPCNFVALSDEISGSGPCHAKKKKRFARFLNYTERAS